MLSADVLRSVRLAAGIFDFLREPLDPGAAAKELRARVERREDSFLRVARGSIFADPRSPHRHLLDWAGWSYARLETAVAEQGLERTLARLRDDGVRTSLAEFKAATPLRRPGLELEAHELGFDNCRLPGHGLRASTSGTGSRAPVHTSYHWGLFAEEASLECLLFDSHDLLDAPLAFWLPSPPGSAGIHNLFVHMRFRRPPERWFSHVATRRRDALRLGYARQVGRLLGMQVPLPEHAAIGDARRVARWMRSARDERGAAVLKTFASSAVRVAEAALREDLDLSGCTFFVGGEPLTERRLEYIVSTGARAFPRYVATETGWIAGACPSSSPGAMHLYQDRLAVVPCTAPGAHPAPLLFTTLSPAAPKVLLNTDIGDAGQIRTRKCGCALGDAGLDMDVIGVHGHDKLSSDGMTLPGNVLSEVLDEVISSSGAPPDAFQVGEREDERGVTRLVIVVSEQVRGLSDEELVRLFLERLSARGDGPRLMATIWSESHAIEVRRETPALSDGQKMRTVVTPPR